MRSSSQAAAHGLCSQINDAVSWLLRSLGLAVSALGMAGTALPPVASSTTNARVARASGARDHARSAIMHRFTGFLIAFSILFGSAFSPALAQHNTLTVFAAASMKNALDDIDTAWTAKSGAKVVASYAASSALAKQI